MSGSKVRRAEGSGSKVRRADGSGSKVRRAGGSRRKVRRTGGTGHSGTEERLRGRQDRVSCAYRPQ
eukprot:19122-Chlamydomonas_euryale.AAC.2